KSERCTTQRGRSFVVGDAALAHGVRARMHRGNFGRTVTNELADRMHGEDVAFVELRVGALDAFEEPERAIEAARQDFAELGRSAHVVEAVTAPERQETMHRLAERAEVRLLRDALRDFLEPSIGERSNAAQRGVEQSIRENRDVLRVAAALFEL